MIVICVIHRVNDGGRPSLVISTYYSQLSCQVLLPNWNQVSRLNGANALSESRLTKNVQ